MKYTRALKICVLSLTILNTAPAHSIFWGLRALASMAQKAVIPQNRGQASNNQRNNPAKSQETGVAKKNDLEKMATLRTWTQAWRISIPPHTPRHAPDCGAFMWH